MVEVGLDISLYAGFGWWIEPLLTGVAHVAVFLVVRLTNLLL